MLNKKLENMLQTRFCYLGSENLIQGRLCNYYGYYHTYILGGMKARNLFLRDDNLSRHKTNLIIRYFLSEKYESLSGYVGRGKS